jgi:phosphoglycerate kinase
MAVTEKEMIVCCETLLAGKAAAADLTLPDYVRDIPGLASLEDVPSGAPVLVRGDLDCEPGPNVGDGDIRLRSMVDTLAFGRKRGWKQIVFGHIGRKPEGSLAKVAKRLGELLQCDVPLVRDWLDESKSRPPGPARSSCWKTLASMKSSGCSGRRRRPIWRSLRPS